MATISTNDITSTVDYTFNSTYDENCIIDGYLCCNNITNLGTNLIQGDLTLTNIGDNYLYCNNKANFYQPVYLFDNAASTNYGEGALTVVGGVGIGGNCRVGYSISVGGNLDCSSNLNVVGDTQINGTLTINTDLNLVGNMTQAGYYNSQFYTTDSRESTTVTEGSIVGLGGCGIGKNLTVGGCINSSITTAPTSVNSLGYQTIASTSTIIGMTANTYYSPLNFVVTSANYGTYMIEFTCQLSPSVTNVNQLTYMALSTTPTFAFTATNLHYGTRTYMYGSNIMKYSRIFSCYTPTTIYAQIRLDTTGTVSLYYGATLIATRIA